MTQDPETTMDIDETLPPIVQEFLRKGYKLEQILLDAQGQWTHQGQAFYNARIIKFFNKSVARTPGGTWVIDVGQFVYPIEVEDCGYFVERIRKHEHGMTLFLSDETQEELDFDSLRYVPQGRLYCTIKQGDFDARFKRDAYHALSDLMVEEDGWIYLTYQEHRVALTSMNDQTE